jgi:hypothetical protein
LIQIVVRYDAITDSYHDDMDGNGVICLAVDILPTEFAKEVSALHIHWIRECYNITGFEND